MSKSQPGGISRRRVKAAPEPLYVRGEYRLYAMTGRNHEIRIYNPTRKKDDCTSAGTTDLELAKIKLDRLYLGEGCCKLCGQQLPQDESADSDLISRIVADYITGHAETRTTADSIKGKLAMVSRYIGDKPVRVGNINEKWIEAFRKWATTEPYYVGPAGNRRAKFRKRSTAEGGVVQLAAAIRFAGKKPLFQPKQFIKFDNSPDFRANVPLMAAMFRWCLYPTGASEKEIDRKRRGRVNVLYYLRMAVATWARPDAILDATLATEKRQWVSDARVFRLNPAERDQTKKHRPIVPVPELVGAWLDTLPKGPILPAEPSKATWGRMMAELKPGLGEGEGGMKLIRRSMSSMALDSLGLEYEGQIDMMMGHRKFKVTDIYTVPKPSLLGRALAFNTAVVEEIEALVPGAFAAPQHHNRTTTAGNVVAMSA